MPVIFADSDLSLVAVALSAIAVLLPNLFGPKRPNDIKLAPYESESCRLVRASSFPISITSLPCSLYSTSRSSFCFLGL